MDYKGWLEKYRTKKILDLKKLLTDDEIELLKKLGLEIEDKIYTEQEFDLIDDELCSYYREDGYTEEELAVTKDLPKDISFEEYNKLLEKFYNIAASI